MSDVFRATEGGEFKGTLSPESPESFEGTIQEDERASHERHVISSDQSSAFSAALPIDHDHGRRAASLDLSDARRMSIPKSGQTHSQIVGGAGGLARVTESSFADVILETPSDAAAMIDPAVAQFHEKKVSCSDYSSSFSRNNSPVLTRESSSEVLGAAQQIGGAAGDALIKGEGSVEIQTAKGSPVDVILPEPQTVAASMIQPPRSDSFKDMVAPGSSQALYSAFSSAFSQLEQSGEGASTVEDPPTEIIQGRMLHQTGQTRSLTRAKRRSAILSELSDGMFDEIDGSESPDSIGLDSIQLGRSAIRIANNTSLTFKRVSGKTTADTLGRTARKKAAKNVAKKTAAVSTNSFAYATPKSAAVASRSVQVVGHTARAIAAGTRALLSALGSAVAALGVWLIPILLIIFVIAGIAMIIPAISLKADDAEISKCYEYVTQRDTELTAKIHSTAKSYQVDYYHWYLNGGSVDESSIILQTNADILIAYLDAKYENYRFDDHWTKKILSFFNPALDDAVNAERGIPVKDEIDAVLSKLYSANYRYWYESDDDSIITHLDIRVSTEDLSGFIQSNYDNIFSHSEKQKYETLLDAGIYTARNYIHNPLGDQGWYLSGRFGYYPDPSWSKTHRGGIEITSMPGTAVYAGIGGIVGSGYNDQLGNYVTISSEETTITYGHLATRAVRAGIHIESDTKIGTVGNSGNTRYPCLYVSISRLRGDTLIALNPLLYLDGYMEAGSGAGSGDIVSVALSQYGVRESPPGSNNVLYNTWYYGAPVHGTSYPWCATFVSWCANQCGYIDAGIFPRTASSGTLQNAARLGYGGIWYPRSSGYVPVAGDIVTYRDHQHTGIVVSSDGSSVMTIEGNTSSDGSFSSDGGCVARKTWPLGWGQIDGYWHPNYPAAEN